MNAKLKQLLCCFLPLVLLVANDSIFKSSYPGLLTGKLSDFAGLWVWALFFLYFFRKSALPIIVLSSLVFIWWKSPLSSPFISFLSSFFGIKLVRTVDFSDLWALLVYIPFYHYQRSILTWMDDLGQVSTRVFLVVSIIAFCATSRPDYAINPNWTFENQIYTIKRSKRAVLQNTIHNSSGQNVDSLNKFSRYHLDYYSIPNIEAEIHIDSVKADESTIQLLSVFSIDFYERKKSISKEEFLELFESSYIKKASTADSTQPYAYYWGRE